MYVLQYFKLRPNSRRCYYLLFLIGLVSFCQEEMNAFASPPKAKRIVFLGNSITYSGQYINDIESYFRIKYPDCKLEFINVGLSSETVSGLSEPGHADGKFPRPNLHDRLARILSVTKPDVVFACYGINDGIYLPFDKNRFLSFKNGINRLHQQVTNSGAEIVHLTPPVYDEVRGGIKEYDAVLEHYSEWLLDQEDQRDWVIVDVHGPMKKYLQKQRKTNPSFYVSSDGVHPDKLGHWLIAQQVLLYFGEKEVKEAPDLRSLFIERSMVDRIIDLVKEKQEISRNAYLSAIGHKRPGIPSGLPLEEAKKKVSAIETKIKSVSGQTPLNNKK